MKNHPTKGIEHCRLLGGPFGSSKHDRSGVFFVLYKGAQLKVLSSDGLGWMDSGMPGEPWEHVSVSLKDRCPTWEEMDFIKRIFWKDDEVVMQLHVPRKDHISFCETCLHLWKPIGLEIPRPPSIAVGPQ